MNIRRRTSRSSGSGPGSIRARMSVTTNTSGRNWPPETTASSRSYARGWAATATAACRSAVTSSARPGSVQAFPRLRSDEKYGGAGDGRSGDAPGYFQFDGFFLRQWDDSLRGSVPISYGISMSLRWLMPGGDAPPLRHGHRERLLLLSDLPGRDIAIRCWDIATRFPIGRRTWMRISILTARNMAQARHGYAGALHPSGPCALECGGQCADPSLCGAIAAGAFDHLRGMHRTGYAPSQGNGFLANGTTTVHHVMTHWSWEDWDLFRAGLRRIFRPPSFWHQGDRSGCRRDEFRDGHVLQLALRTPPSGSGQEMLEKRRVCLCHDERIRRSVSGKANKQITKTSYEKRTIE